MGDRIKAKDKKLFSSQQHFLNELRLTSKGAATGGASVDDLQALLFSPSLFTQDPSSSLQAVAEQTSNHHKTTLQGAKNHAAHHQS
jgi:hypothetical protein